MEAPGQKNRFGKLRLSYIFALITVAAGAGGYGYHLFRLARDSQINKPQPQVEQIGDVADDHLAKKRIRLSQIRSCAVQ